jgi:hypothetical protein
MLTKRADKMPVPITMELFISRVFLTGAVCLRDSVLQIFFDLG